MLDLIQVMNILSQSGRKLQDNSIFSDGLLFERGTRVIKP
jgi:hypothetical protein